MSPKYIIQVNLTSSNNVVSISGINSTTTSLISTVLLSGKQGVKGDTATVSIGTVSTLAPGASATFTNVGTSSSAVFNIGIPQGPTGTTGSDGLVVDPSQPAATNVIWLDTDDTPLALTKSDMGLGSVDNTSDASKPVSTATAAALAAKADTSTLTAHTSNTSNPHSVTKTQVGLSNVDNTSDINKPISNVMQTAIDAAADDALALAVAL